MAADPVVTGNVSALRSAAEWAQRHVLEAGGTCDLVEIDGHPPLVVGDLRSSREDAPTVLIYGHYDVQDTGGDEKWTTPPFEPDIRDGRIWARGASDDKGNFLPLLLVACELADAGALPVHVRVLIEGEEESNADTADRWMRADERGADCAIVFDAGMLDPATPALTVATRGIVWAEVEVRTGERPAHSGEFGGAALNAVHVLHRLLAAVLPDGSGRPPEPLRAGLSEPTAEEVAAWESLPPGDELLASAGARPADPDAGAELHRRTMAGASLDVHRITAGEARTIVPEVASASLSVRLAADQRADEIGPALEALLRGALPEGADLDLHVDGADPSRFDPASPPLVAARRALARATGTDPVLIRSGGSIPILAVLAERGIPAIVGGFGLPDDRIHAPDESYSLDSLRLGLASARALYEELAAPLGGPAARAELARDRPRGLGDRGGDALRRAARQQLARSRRRRRSRRPRGRAWSKIGAATLDSPSTASSRSRATPFSRTSSSSAASALAVSVRLVSLRQRLGDQLLEHRLGRERQHRLAERARVRGQLRADLEHLERRVRPEDVVHDHDRRRRAARRRGRPRPCAARAARRARSSARAAR